MPDSDAARFRARANECRRLAPRADPETGRFLLELAVDLEDEADKIDAEGDNPAIRLPSG